MREQGPLTLSGPGPASTGKPLRSHKLASALPARGASAQKRCSAISVHPATYRPWPVRCCRLAAASSSKALKRLECEKTTVRGLAAPGQGHLSGCTRGLKGGPSMHAQSADVVKQHFQECLPTTQHCRHAAAAPQAPAAAGRGRVCAAGMPAQPVQEPEHRGAGRGGQGAAGGLQGARSGAVCAALPVSASGGVTAANAAPARCWTLARWWRATCAGCCWPTLGPRSSRRGAPASLRPCQRRRCCRSRAVARRGRAQVESPRGDALRSLRLTDATGTSLWWRSYVCGVAALAPRAPRPCPQSPRATRRAAAQGRNRQCVTLDLHTAEGRDLARARTR